MTKRQQRWASLIFGVIFVGILMLIALVIPSPSPFQHLVFRCLLALAAAGVAGTFTGFLEVQISVWLRASGALAVLAIVYFYNPASLILSIPEEVEVIFTPIEHRESLIKSFNIEGEGERVVLNFESVNFGLNFPFKAPINIRAYSLISAIKSHFSLGKHVKIKGTFSPATFSGSLEAWWLLVINGREIDSDEEFSTLKELALIDGDHVALRIKWLVTIQVSSPPSGDLDVLDHTSPPDIDI